MFWSNLALGKKGLTGLTSGEHILPFLEMLHWQPLLPAERASLAWHRWRRMAMLFGSRKTQGSWVMSVWLIFPGNPQPNPTKWGPMRSLHVSNMHFLHIMAPGPESCGEVKQSAQGCGFANHLLVCYAVKKTRGNTTVDARPMTAQICWSWRHLRHLGI